MSGLRRDIKYGGWLGGVCQGLGNFFMLSPALFRLLFILGFFYGFGVTCLIYLVMWFAIPSNIYD